MKKEKTYYQIGKIMKKNKPVKHEITRDVKGRFIGSGNPNGRPPKNLCMSDLLKDVGEEVYDNTSLMERVAHKVYELAINGNMRAIEFITERLEGRPFTKDSKQEWTKPFTNVVFSECSDEDCPCSDCRKNDSLSGI